MEVQDQAELPTTDDYLEHDLPEVEDNPDSEDAEQVPEDSADQPGEEAEDDIIIEGLETAPVSAEPETPLLKDLRVKLREEAKQRKQLERELQAAKAAQQTPQVEQPVVLGPKPTLETAGYDEEAYQQQLDVWYETKARADEQKRKQELAQQQAQQEFAAVINSHKQKAQALKKPDYEEMAEVVGSSLTPVQQEFILRGADDSARLVYALGKYPAKLQELAAIKDPAKFAFAVAKLEANLKVTKKPTVQPEKVLNGGKGVVSSDKELARLEAEAERTGDRTKVLAYKRKLKNQS